MLLNRLKETNELLSLKEENNQVEDRQKEIERAKKRISDIKNTLDKYSTSIKNLKKTYGESFDYSDLSALYRLVDTLENDFKNDYIDMNLIDKINKQVNDLESSLKEEWKDFYKARTTSIRSTVDSTKNLVPQNDNVSIVLNALNPNHMYWPVSERNINIIEGNILTAKDIVNDLGVDNVEVKRFIDLITHEKATIADLTPEILGWIKDKKLEGKIGLTFKSV